MLPAGHRLTRRTDFAETIRLGSRAARATVVAHLHLTPGQAPARVGFVVSKAVGGSVVRHRVTRQLRAIMATRLQAVPSGSRLVVRALPASASASFVQLDSDVDAAIQSAVAKASRS